MWLRSAKCVFQLLLCGTPGGFRSEACAGRRKAHAIHVVPRCFSNVAPLFWMSFRVGVDKNCQPANIITFNVQSFWGFKFDRFVMSCEGLDSLDCSARATFQGLASAGDGEAPRVQPK